MSAGVKSFTLTGLNSVAMWVYNNTGDSCSICKNALNEACIKCQSNQDNYDTTQCRKVVGQCNHCYHIHCIEEWVKKQNNCPYCFNEWVAMKYMD